MQALNRNLPGVSVACFVVLGTLCGACSGAQGVDFFEPAPIGLVSSAGAAGALVAAAGAPGAGVPGASGGAPSAGAGGTTVTLEPSLPEAGAPSAGSAGSVAMPTMRSLVDDMEANVSSIPEAEGRAGYWYTFNDGKGGTQQPAPNGPFLPELVSGGCPGSTRARHTQGSGFTSYAGFGFDLNNRSGQRLTYDASAYRGIVLWVRGSVPVRVMFPTRSTAPTNEGGTCTSSCNDSFGLEVTPSADWSELAVPFVLLQQLSPTAAEFDSTSLLGIAFSVEVGSDFDVWVDEIGFY